MIPQNTTIVAIAIVALLTNTQALELFSPLSECNANQSNVMKTKYNKLSGLAYSTCERETLQQFFKCVESDKGVEDEK